MKTHRNHERKIGSITNGRWTAYAAAAAASGFAATHTAEATIHYSGLVNQNIIGDREVTFPLDPAGGSFLARHSNNYYGARKAGGGAFFRIYGAQSASVNGIYGGRNFPIVFPYKLDRGYRISAAFHFAAQKICGPHFGL